MRLAQPALRQSVHVHNAQPGMCVRKLIQDSSRRVLRPIIDGNDFQSRIIDFHQRRKSGGQLLFLIARRKKNGDSGTLRIRRRRKISYPRQLYRSVSNPEPVAHPK